MNSEESYSVDDPRFRITPLQQMGSACTGAFVTSIIMTPFDVVKIRLQAQQKANLSNKCFLYCNGLMDHLCPCHDGNVTYSNQTNYWYRRPSQFNGTLDAFSKICKQEGVTSLWSGLGPTLILAIPATVVYFVTYEQLRVRLKDAYNAKFNQGILNPEQPTWIPLLCGASARIWAATLVSPLELIRTKMQSKKLSYRETGQAVKSVLQYQGVVGLWKGLGPTLLRDVPFSAIYWLHYEGIKKIFSQQTPTFGFSFIAGGISGSIASILTLPFDVVKTHQQIEMGEKEICQDPPCRSKTSTMSQVMKRIIRADGIKGLFTGIVPRVFKVAPACAVMVSSFEYGKNFFQMYNKKVFLETIDLVEKNSEDLRSQTLRL